MNDVLSTMSQKSTGLDGTDNPIVAVLAAGYAIQYIFDVLPTWRRWFEDKDNDEGSRLRCDMRATTAAILFIVDMFRQKGVAFDEQLRPMLPAIPLEAARLVSLHKEAVKLAAEALHGAADATFRMWSDPDWVVLEFEWGIDRFTAGPLPLYRRANRESGSWSGGSTLLLPPVRASMMPNNRYHKIFREEHDVVP